MATDRGLNAFEESAVSSDVILPVWLFELGLDSGELRFCSHSNDLTLGGNTFTATPDIVSFSPAEETSSVVSNPASLRISAIPNSTVHMALDEEFQNRPMKAWLGLLSSPNTTTVTGSLLIFSGLMDKMTIHKGPEDSVVEIVAESYLVDLTNPKARRYTNSDQVSFVNAADEGFSFMAELQEKPILFGGREAFLSDENLLGVGVEEGFRPDRG